MMMRILMRSVIFLIAWLGLWPRPLVSAADRLRLSSHNLTAFDLDHLVAQEKGFFAQQNLDVNITYMAPDLSIKALLAETVDIAKSGTHFGIIAAARGAELKVIGGSLYGYPYDVIGQSQFKSLGDLKGQKIAGASLASITTVLFKDVMAHQGMSPADYTLIFVGGSNERFQAVNSGLVAASLAEAPPFNFKSIDAGKKVLLRYGDQVKDLLYAGYFSSRRSLAQNRPLLARFMGAIAQSMRWLNSPGNEKEVMQILIRRFKIDEAVATRTYNYLIPENKAFRGETAVDGPGMAEMIRLLADYQMIPAREPWQSFVDASFLPTAKTSGEQ